MVSGSISLRSQRFFSPFPRGTCSLSVADEYLALRGGPRCFALRSTCGVLLRIPGLVLSDFAYAALTLSGRLFQAVLLSVRSQLSQVLQPRRSTCGLGSTAFARHYLRYRFLFLFLRLLRCFTSAGLAIVTLCLQVTSIVRSDY